MFWKNIVHAINQHRKQWPQILCILISCFSGILYGLSYAWMSPAILGITLDEENYNLTENDVFLTVIPLTTVAIAAVLFSYLNDAIGRRITLMIMLIPYMIFWMIIIYHKWMYSIYFAKILEGITECVFISLPMHIGEIASPEIRCSWGYMLPFSRYFGIFLLNVILKYNTINRTAYISLGLCIIFLSICPFIQETPYYYLMKRKESKVKNTLQYMYQEDDVHGKYQSLMDDVHRQMFEPGTWMSLFTIPTNRKALLRGLYLQMAIPFSGSTCLILYGEEIFEQSADTLFIIYMGTYCIACIFAAFSVSKLGSKVSFRYSSLFCTIFLLIQTIYFYYKHHSPDSVEGFQWVPVTISMLFCISHALGVGTLGVLMMGELFSLRVKSKGLALCTFAYIIAEVFNNKIFNVLLTFYSLFASLLYLTCTCGFFFLFSFRMVPETYKKTLGEIQQDFAIK
ncbi:unnamed protein product [Brassicogethes aeneus]|uniref:Uncharacterized protein n=1 Tax=Brassicogethes aeneus TaxID=1431903 RepID=A0A9P0AWP2_BRAAE|nr:unnamed protein product [Brassicogethes aeneus]